uniref:Uncharacterized protein n=1 Tax=viral metagenome TaxID=1070528 RepID=A0A6M3LFS7_9ZZZZ
MEIMFFTNGNTATFDDEGKQITDMQTPWIVLYFEYLEGKGIDPAKCRFSLPDGGYAEPFKTDDDTWNWRIT